MGHRPKIKVCALCQRQLALQMRNFPQCRFRSTYSKVIDARTKKFQSFESARTKVRITGPIKENTAKRRHPCVVIVLEIEQLFVIHLSVRIGAVSCRQGIADLSIADLPVQLSKTPTAKRG